MNKFSILKSIYESVNKIQFKTPFIKHKALLFCEVLFNNYVYRNVLFNNYIQMPHNYIKTFIPKNDHYITIIKELINNEIIIVDNSYSNFEGKSFSKSYKFNNKIINNYNKIDYILYVSPASKPQPSSIPEDEFSSNYLIEYTERMLGYLTTTSKTTEIIENKKIDKTKIILNEAINEDEFYYLIINNRKYEDKLFNVKYGKEVAKCLNMALILYKDKMYIDNPNHFVEEKELSNKIINKLKVFKIENGDFSVNRNTTNDRLDTNITNLSKDILDTLLFKGEEIEELDLNNSQFAFLSYITKDLDNNFMEWSQKGILYQKIGDILGITRQQAKDKMFRIAFDKIKKEYDDIRTIFPKTMKFIDDYKTIYGYKMFSNLLQKKESQIMIDGLLKYLYIKGYEVLTIHDSIRVNKSIAPIIKLEMELYFNSIGFKCKMKNK